MPQDQNTSAQATAQAVAPKINIPDETKGQFPEFIPMILESPSMNDEERQYWVDVLPIMTEDQIKNLRDILTTEKNQISEANKAYANGMDKAKIKVSINFNEAAYKAKKRAIHDAEKTSEVEEKVSEDQMLKEIEEMRA